MIAALVVWAPWVVLTVAAALVGGFVAGLAFQAQRHPIPRSQAEAMRIAFLLRVYRARHTDLCTTTDQCTCGLTAWRALGEGAAT